MIPSEVYALGASGNPIREIADYAMRRAEEVGADDLLFANNIMMTSTSLLVGNLSKIIK